jgi:hypothetical protein
MVKPSAVSGNSMSMAFGFGSLPKFEIKTSLDKSKIMILYRLKPEVKNDSKNKDIMGMFVYDTSLEKIWGEEKTMPYTEKDMDNLNYGVGNKGYIFTLIRNKPEEKYEILAFNQDGMESKDLGISTDMYLHNLKIVETSEGIVRCSGFYANGIEFKVGFGGGSFVINTDGIFTFTMDGDGNVLSKNKIPFELDFMKKYLSDRQKKKVEKREAEGKGGIIGLQMIDFKMQEDNSFVIVGECQYVSVEPWGTNLSATVYHYANIVAAKLSENGEIVWIKKLPKNQAGLNGIGGMSLKYMNNLGKHYFLFLDNNKNAQLSSTEVPAAHKDGLGGILVAYIIDDASGDVEKHSLVDLVNVNGKKLYQFNVSRIFEGSDGVLMTESYLKKKQDGLVKMEVR